MSDDDLARRAAILDREAIRSLAKQATTDAARDKLRTVVEKAVTIRRETALGAWARDLAATKARVTTSESDVTAAERELQEATNVVEQLTERLTAINGSIVAVLALASLAGARGALDDAAGDPAGRGIALVLAAWWLGRLAMAPPSGSRAAGVMATLVLTGTVAVFEADPTQTWSLWLAPAAAVVVAHLGGMAAQRADRHPLEEVSVRIRLGRAHRRARTARSRADAATAAKARAEGEVTALEARSVSGTAHFDALSAQMVALVEGTS